MINTSSQIGRAMLALVALAVLVAFLAGVATADSHLLLPDLQPLVPDSMYIERDNETGGRRLRFSTIIANLGDGPLIVNGVYDPGRNQTRVTQLIMTESDETVERVAGYFVFHPGHDHWHFEDFFWFELWSYRPDGSLDTLHATTGKMSYCLWDNRRVLPRPPNSPQFRVYTDCDQTIQQGISPGWADRYRPQLEGQSLDITDVPDGRYALRTTADPDNRLQETDETNNSLVVYVEIRGMALERLTDPPPSIHVEIASAPSQVQAVAEPEVETIVSGLVAPWAVAFAPDGRIFLTERPGRVRVIQDGALLPEPVATLPDVAARGEGGLLGMALDPGFDENGWLYLYYTYSDGGEQRNRVVRYVAEGSRLAEDTREVLIDGIPGANIHNGGRIAFGPDGLLYVATGDAARAVQAQDLDSLAGKILRIHPDGAIPTDNPFPGSPIYSYGHRNVQGLAWQPGTGRLYATEHGPSGNDELNLIEPGENYGWPEVQGSNHKDPYRAPIHWYEQSIAPAGATFYDGTRMPQWTNHLFFGTLRGTHLQHVSFAGEDQLEVESAERLYGGEYGRLRDIVQGPDGALYVVTSNRDGRGNPIQEDDRLLRIAPPEDS